MTDNTKNGDRATPRQMQRQQIFVINGAPEFLDIVRELLQDERYNVTTTNFVPRTFEQITGLPPQLLIVELAFGEDAGWDLLAQLRRGAATNAIPVVLVSTQLKLLEQARTNHAL